MLFFKHNIIVNKLFYSDLNLSVPIQGHRNTFLGITPIHNASMAHPMIGRVFVELFIGLMSPEMSSKVGFFVLYH